MVHFDETDVFELSWRDHIYNDTLFCEVYPSRLNSHGIWEKMDYQYVGMEFWEYPLPLLEIVICSALFLWLFFDTCFKKLGTRIPKFASMMLAGIVIKQTSLLDSDSVFSEIFFPDYYRPKVPETIGAFGFAMYWFLKGVSMDVGILKRTGARASVIGVSTMLVPLVVSFTVFISTVKYGDEYLTGPECRIIAFVESISGFTGINMLLKDLNIIHTEFGRIAQSSAMVNDIVVFVMAFGLMVLADFEVGIRKTAGFIMFIIIMVFIIRPFMFWIIKRTPEGRPVKDIYINIILILVYLSYLYWRSFNLFGPIGSFLFGLIIPDGPPLGSTIVRRFEGFNLGVFLPLFGSLCMKQLDLVWFVHEIWGFRQRKGQLYAVLSVILLVFSTKFITVTITAFATKMPLRDSIVLAVSLNNKGIYELAYYVSSFELRYMSPVVFNSVATSCLLNSLIMPIVLDSLYAPSKRYLSYQKRNLLNLKPGSELSTLVCIHKPDHIKPMINVLEALRPSKDSRLGCYVLHLIELEGQDCSNFISHQMQKPQVGTISCSDNVITSFNKLHQKFGDSISVQLFTSISSANHMHEDVCWLALDKSLSLILLPFHRTWSLDRSTVVSDDDSIRNFNLNVLKQAPCSVGILVYRNPIWVPHITDSHFNVCLVFVGGKDDREALALTNRMRLMNPKMSLTFLRFTPTIWSEVVDERVQILNSMDLEDIIRNNDHVCVKDFDSVKCIDRRVVDGIETSTILRSMAFDYDLFIVGRNIKMKTAVTAGLAEWTEFEELGIIGDILASPDYPSRTSVLVVQQQEYYSK